MPVQTIFIKSQAYGQPVIRGLELVHAQLQRAEGRAWFCETCGEVWARAVVEGGVFRVLSAPCEDHLDSLMNIRIPGSLLIPLEKEFNDSLPLELWRREFELHVRFFERQNQS